MTARLLLGLAWLDDTLRPSHWCYWADWWRDWRGIRRRSSRKMLAARVYLLEDRQRAEAARTRAIFALMEEATRAAGIGTAGGRPVVAGTAAYSDPAVARIQERRRRIEASGLQLIPGGAQ